MSSSEYLFPNRLTRRDFLRVGALSATALATAPLGRAQDAAVKLGSGQWTYTLDPEWGKLPEGMKFGLGCGIVVDGKGRVIVTSRSKSPCVAVFDRDGKLLETWSNDFAEKVGYASGDQVAATAHCIYWSKEGPDEFFYFTENVAGGGKNPDGTEKPKLGARVYKTDLEGRILYTIGNVASEDATHQKFDWTSPTDVAVAPNGDIYVVDGYGSQRVSRFDRNWKHLKTFGGKGKTNETFNICHGIWVDTRKETPEIYIADRANGRLQVYDLELNYKRTIAGDFVRNPCCFYQHAGHLYVPDLAAMVTILDGDDKPVAILGDGKPLLGGKRATADMEGKNPEVFFAPHALTLDSEGSIYVVEWVGWGRVRKFRHTPV
jgi:peptidylamidoglycolate lyase